MKPWELRRKLKTNFNMQERLLARVPENITNCRHMAENTLFLDPVNSFSEYIDLEATIFNAFNFSELDMYYMSTGNLAIKHSYQQYTDGEKLEVVYFIEDADNALRRLTNGQCVIDTHEMKQSSTYVKCLNKG